MYAKAIRLREARTLTTTVLLFLVALCCCMSASSEEQAGMPELPRPPRSVSLWEPYIWQATEHNRLLRDSASTVQGSYPVQLETVEIGRSQMGRPLLMVTVSAVDSDRDLTKRVMVVAGQHGDEPAGMFGMIELIRQFAVSTDPSIADFMQRVTLYIVPVANPDGACLCRRGTENGRNMNRDWRALRTLEAASISQAIDEARPDVLLDLHEETPRDRSGSFVLASQMPSASEMVKAVRAAFGKHGYRIPVLRSGKVTNLGLLHEEFARKYGKLSLLVETKFTRDAHSNLEHRAFVHLTAVMAVVKCLAADS